MTSKRKGGLEVLMGLAAWRIFDRQEIKTVNIENAFFEKVTGWLATLGLKRRGFECVPWVDEDHEFVAVRDGGLDLENFGLIMRNIETVPRGVQVYENPDAPMLVFASSESDLPPDLNFDRIH